MLRKILNFEKRASDSIVILVMYRLLKYRTRSINRNFLFSHSAVKLVYQNFALPSRNKFFKPSNVINVDREKIRRSNVLQEDSENLEALEDFINEESNISSQELQSKTETLMQRAMQRERLALRRNIIGKKYFKPEPEANVLSWRAKEQIRYLNSMFPDEWTPDEIANSFPISVDGVQRVLKSTYKLRTVTDVRKHDNQVARRWRKLRKILAHWTGPTPEECKEFRLFTNPEKIHLLANAAGTPALPMPQEKILSSMSVIEKDKQVGMFEAIVASAETGTDKSHDNMKEQCEIDDMKNRKVLKEILDSHRKNGIGCISHYFLGYNQHRTD